MKKMRVKKYVYEYWNNSPLKSSLNPQAFNGDGKERCMACGVDTVCDRAHIVSKMYGGSNKSSNLHCLCKKCHVLSEGFEGHDYWLWIALKSSLFRYGIDMTYELDFKKSEEDGEIVPYADPAEYPSKLQKYADEYTVLSLLENNFKNSAICYFELSGLVGKRLKINYPNLKDIEKVMEVQEGETIHLYLQSVQGLNV